MNCAFLAANRGHLQSLGAGFGMMFIHIAKLLVITTVWLQQRIHFS